MICSISLLSQHQVCWRRIVFCRGLAHSRAAGGCRIAQIKVSKKTSKNNRLQLDAMAISEDVRKHRLWLRGAIQVVRRRQEIPPLA